MSKNAANFVFDDEFETLANLNDQVLTSSDVGIYVHKKEGYSSITTTIILGSDITNEIGFKKGDKVLVALTPNKKFVRLTRAGKTPGGYTISQNVGGNQLRVAVTRILTETCFTRKCEVVRMRDGEIVIAL